MISVTSPLSLKMLAKTRAVAAACPSLVVKAWTALASPAKSQEEICPAEPAKARTSVTNLVTVETLADWITASKS